MFLDDLGIKESGLDKLIKASYSLLGLCSYLTSGEDETRAWTIKIGTKAPQAALERDMTIFEKSGPYIDNIVSREAMLKEIYKSLEAANKNGSAIVIAHVDKSAEILPKLLEQMYPYLLKAGYRFATPSTLR